jgi:hypothetical protein
MKKNLLLCSLFILVLAASRGFAAPADETAPEEVFLKNCFKDYVSQIKKPNDKVKKRCVSIPFRSEWKSLAEKTKGDPLLLAEEPDASWASHIEVEDLNVKKGTAKVILGEDDTSHCLKVKIEKTGDDLKIASTKKCHK